MLWHCGWSAFWSCSGRSCPESVGRLRDCSPVCSPLCYYLHLLGGQGVATTGFYLHKNFNIFKDRCLVGNFSSWDKKRLQARCWDQVVPVLQRIGVGVLLLQRWILVSCPIPTMCEVRMTCYVHITLYQLFPIHSLLKSFQLKEQLWD